MKSKDPDLSNGSTENKLYWRALGAIILTLSGQMRYMQRRV